MKRHVGGGGSAAMTFVMIQSDIKRRIVAREVPKNMNVLANKMKRGTHINR